MGGFGVRAATRPSERSDGQYMELSPSQAITIASSRNAHPPHVGLKREARKLSLMGTREWLLIGMWKEQFRHMLRSNARPDVVARRLPGWSSASLAAKEASEWWHECPYRLHDLLALLSDDETRVASEVLLDRLVDHLHTACSKCVFVRNLRGDIMRFVAMRKQGDWPDNPTSARHARAIIAARNDVADTSDGHGNVSLWDTSDFNTMHGMFKRKRWTGIIDLRFWDTRKMCDMSDAFTRCGGVVFGLERWIVSRVTNMDSMFAGARAFNLAIGNWDTRRVVNMRHMFLCAVTFNQELCFDTRSVEDMEYMFSDTLVFNKPVRFNTARVVRMRGMFRNARSFNQAVDFQTARVEDMSEMFAGADAFNKPVRFNTVRVTRAADMFAGAGAFNQLVDFDMRRVQDVWSARDMFAGCTALTMRVHLRNLGVVLA